MTLREAPSITTTTQIEHSNRRRPLWRKCIAASAAANFAYRAAVGAIGFLVLVVGIVAIPYPGPGWLIVFTGLGILASEFVWARRALRWLRARSVSFMAWFSRRAIWAKAVGVLVTIAFVVATLWVLGTVSLVGGWLGYEQASLDGLL